VRSPSSWPISFRAAAPPEQPPPPRRCGWGGSVLCSLCTAKGELELVSRGEEEAEGYELSPVDTLTSATTVLGLSTRAAVPGLPFSTSFLATFHLIDMDPSRGTGSDVREGGERVQGEQVGPRCLGQLVGGEDGEVESILVPLNRLGMHDAAHLALDKLCAWPSGVCKSTQFFRRSQVQPPHFATGSVVSPSLLRRS
jgi:hypothetical protein